jgi:multidrug resistance protein
MTHSLQEFSTKYPSPSMRSRRISMILLLLASCITLLMTGYMVIAPVFPQRLHALGLGAGTLALMEMAFGLGMFLFSTPMGTLADRLGRKPIVMIALAGFVVTNILLVLVNAPLFFIAIRFVEGVCISGLLPTATAMVADLVPEERRGRWLGTLMAAQAAGIAIGPGIGGLMFQAWGFIVPFLLSAGIAALASILALLFIPETLPENVREQAHKRKADNQPGSRRLAWLTSFLQPVGFFGVLLLIDFSLNFVYPFVVPLYPFYFAQALGYSPAQYGAILGIYGLALAVFPLLFGRFVDGSFKLLLIALGCVLFTGLNVGMLFFVQYPLLILAAIVAGMGQAFWMPGLGTIYLSATNEQNRSQVMGLRQTALALGIVLGPLLQTLILPWVAPRTSFSVGAIIPVGASILVLTVLSRRSQDKQREEVKAGANPTDRGKKGTKRSLLVDRALWPGRDCLWRGRDCRDFSG